MNPRRILTQTMSVLSPGLASALAESSRTALGRIAIATALMSVTAALAQTRETAQTQPSPQPTTSIATTSTSAPATQPAVHAAPREIPPALAAAMRSAATRPTTGPLLPRVGSFRDTYQVVVDRNMFTRTHYIRSSDSSEARRLSEQERAQRRQILVLTGVVEEARQYIAFIENTRTGETERHAAGDSLVQGKVVKIDFDSIVYDNGNGQPIRIEVGMNLDGHLPEFSSYSSGSSSGNNLGYSSNSAGATTAPSAGSSPGVNAPAGVTAPAPAPGSASDIAERLRQRRLQETKQGAGQ
jgi:hypothetical protein